MVQIEQSDLIFFLNIASISATQTNRCLYRLLLCFNGNSNIGLLKSFFF